MFRVGTGLDSQILGDFEIISQIRTSFSQSTLGLASNFMERLVKCSNSGK
jgi:glutamyl-tRNA reductase